MQVPAAAWNLCWGRAGRVHCLHYLGRSIPDSCMKISRFGCTLNPVLKMPTTKILGGGGTARLRRNDGLTGRSSACRKNILNPRPRCPSTETYGKDRDRDRVSIGEMNKIRDWIEMATK